jgi:hypothetical protein
MIYKSLDLSVDIRFLVRELDQQGCTNPFRLTFEQRVEDCKAKKPEFHAMSLEADWETDYA